MTKQEDIFTNIQAFLNDENSTIPETEIRYFDVGEICEACDEDGFEACQGHLFIEDAGASL